MADEDVTRELRVRQAALVTRALHVSAEDLLGKAINLAPLEEGTLRGSGTVTMIVNGTRYEGEGALVAAIEAVTALARAGVAYHVDAETSFNTVYAAAQHERTDYHHDVGQAKYLEQPFRENLNRYEAVIRRASEAATA